MSLVCAQLQEGTTEADLEAQFQRSRQVLRESSEFQGSDAGTHLHLAHALHHRGDLTGAAEEYRAAIALEPSLVEAYRGLGVVLMDRHDWAGAAEALRAAVRLRPDDAELFYWLGRSPMA
jgi:Flp pilus assembly protein TadD